MKFEELKGPLDEISKDQLKEKLMKSHKLESQKLIDELHDPKVNVEFDNSKRVINIDDI
jgi:hypothetical protein